MLALLHVLSLVYIDPMGPLCRDLAEIIRLARNQEPNDQPEETEDGTEDLDDQNLDETKAS